MKIEIKAIKGAEHPIRTESDNEKMDELVQSIKEQGLIVPIKVRPLGDEYEVVYGHRRLHACKELGLAEIECIVEGVDDNDQLIQSLIENVVREDMSIFDTAKALSLLQTATGWGKIEIEKRGIMSRSRQIDFERIIELPEEIHSLISEPSQDGKYDKGKVTQRHVQRVTESGVDKPTVVSVLKKAAEEGLSSEQTRKVAEAVKQAETPEERQAILDTPMDNPMFERMVRAKAKAEIERKAVEAERHMGNTQEVKGFLDSIKAFEKSIKEVMEAIDYRKFSPEAIQFTLNRLEKVSESINDLTIKLMEAK